MRVLEKNTIFIPLVALVILATGLAIYFMQQVVKDTRQNLTALPQSFVTDMHNSLRQTNFALMKLDIHIKTAAEPPLDEVIGDLIRIQNRLFHIGSTMEKFGLETEQQVFFRVEGGVLYALVGNLIGTLKTGEPLVGDRAEQIRDMAIAIDDQATWLHSRARQVVHDLRLQQAVFLTRMGYVLSGMLVLLSGLVITIAVILRLVFRQKNILDSLVRRDRLTMLGNRRAFDDFLDVELAHARRHGTPLAVLMLDVDHFKQFNDRYGHMQGNEVLKAIANTLSKHMKRREDRAFRIGGEEFICVYKSTEEDGARNVADSILEAVRDLDITHADSPAADYITLSGGLMYVSNVGNLTADHIYSLADTALYDAKDRGRDCLCLVRGEFVDTDGPGQGKTSDLFSPVLSDPA